MRECHVSGDEHADHAAMVGHATLPDAQQHQRVIEKAAEVVQQGVTDTPAQNGAQREIEHQVADFPGTPLRPLAARTQAAKPPAADKGDQIHQAVPVHLQGTDRNGDGVDIRICQHDYSQVGMMRQNSAFR